MNVTAMDEENQNEFTSCSPSQEDSSPSTPDVSPPENHGGSPTHHSHRPGTVIPNRIFVGGFDCMVNESDLRHIFSQHGAIKEVKIVLKSSGMSKGYGFVTFESEDDALKVLRNANGICFNDKKLNIGQAVRKQHNSGHAKSAPVTLPDSPRPLPLHLATSAGYPYTYLNGVAYFHCPNMRPPTYHWPAAPPVIRPRSRQPVFQQPAHLYHQCAPNQYQWNVVQSPMASSPVVYSQQSECLYQPADEGPVQPPLPLMEDTTPEFADPAAQQVYPQYPPRTEGATAIFQQHDDGKWVHLKPKDQRHIHHKNLRDLPEAAETPDASVLPFSPFSHVD